jgi:lysophospholipase L1-like esterase
MTKFPTSFPTQTMLAVATTAAILLGIHYGTRTARGLDPAVLHPAVEFPRDRAAIFPIVPIAPPPVPETLAIPDPMLHGRTSAEAANPTLESEFLVDDAGALDHFYSALADLSTGKRDHPVRVLHYGDSPTTADLITGDARQLLQQRFGDAGSGFVLIAKPWAWYGHHGVDVSGDGWKIDTAVGSMREAAYGLGGAIFTGGPGAVSTIRIEPGEATSIEVEYLAEPNAGNVEITADGTPAGTIKTDGDPSTNGATSVELPAGTKQVRLTVSGGQVKLFGVAFARSANGVTYDSIGLNGASTTVMSRAFSPTNWAGALQHRDPDLVIINYGTNESGFGSFVDHQYETELRRAIARVRAAVPSASILIMSPMDRGTYLDGNAIATMPAIPRLVAIQQRVAKELGCGFFDTYDAMGGNGTMARWYNGHPRMVAADLIHPSPQGARLVAELLTGQMLIGYERYLQHQHPARQLAAAGVKTSNDLGAPGPDSRTWVHATASTSTTQAQPKGVQ